MKTFPVILFISCFVSSEVKSQISEFAPIGAKWWYHYSHFSAEGYVMMESIGDTVILSKSCKKISVSQTEIDLSNPFSEPNTYYRPMEYLYQDSGKIYCYRFGEFYKLFDFDADIGDEWIIPGRFAADPCDSIGYVQLEQKSDTIISGITLRKLVIDTINNSAWSYGSFPIYEKIGSTGYMFPGLIACVTDIYEGGPLRCYEDNEIGLVKFVDEECELVVGVNDLEAKSNIHIYPQPADDFIYVSTNSYYQNLTVQIHDFTGKEILAFHSAASQSLYPINVAHLPPGMYVISVFGDDEIIGFQKIVKQ